MQKQRQRQSLLAGVLGRQAPEPHLQRPSAEAKGAEVLESVLRKRKREEWQVDRKEKALADRKNQKALVSRKIIFACAKQYAQE